WRSPDRLTSGRRPLQVAGSRGQPRRAGRRSPTISPSTTTG
ncbi:MAG: hypothetical protein AVDCRST_MAG38-2233, partial [uncultured Solirubrobacteraceae bacterium]